MTKRKIKKIKPLTEEQKKEMFWYLQDKLNDLEAGCGMCSDIDCSSCYIYSMLKKKHQFDVIDKKACKKQMKGNASVLRKIVYHPYFKKQRMSECHHCKKKLERDDLKWGKVHTDYIGSTRMDHFCKVCVKKFKIKGLVE